jgi:hypothetical protein
MEPVTFSTGHLETLGSRVDAYTPTQIDQGSVIGKLSSEQILRPRTILAGLFEGRQGK